MISYNSNTLKYQIGHNNHTSSSQTKEQIKKINQVLESEKGKETFSINIEKQLLTVRNTDTARQSHFAMALPHPESFVIQCLGLRCDKWQPPSTLNKFSS
ncbi:hypothetical protein [Pseudomonas chlororaphis]|uniref:hypothetical protein n=1 Tax=Pseudomonas chlororaphis TaxID=587753 RepID=UPI000F58371E|nr:hypothetical protein [Pseudomonas chlororaphis]WDG70333.1 hypothetical protein PUP65_19670 [Pseudomonas chlororaphis]WDH31881.1 hypothetical protein PUP81_14650 [Pseudomonas chlororaphis]WDH68859.1 hypothetical protein PUP78_19655 [Pseudomonas chlororaphis]